MSQKKYKSKKKHKTRKLCKRHTSFLQTAPHIIHVKGYRILLLPMKKKFTFIQSYINAGFVSENKNNTGIAHLLEHLLVDAWIKCKNQPCEKYWNRQGIENNASTDLSLSNYWIRGLEKYTPEMLEYIIAITCNPIFHQSAISREKKIVQNELLIIQNEPISKLYSACSKALYLAPGLQYSNDVSQQLANLKKFTKSYLMQFNRTHYIPFNILFTVAGRFKQNHIIKLFKKYLPTRKQTIVPPSPAVCFTNTQRIIYSKNKEAKNTTIIFIFHIPPLHNRYDQMYFPIVNDILGGPMSSVLMKILRLKLKLIYGLTLTIESLFCGSVITIEMSTKDKNIKQTIIMTMKTIKKFLHTNIDHYLLENIKNKHLLRVYQTCTNPGNLASFYAIQYMNQIYDSDPIIYTPNNIKNAIKKITASYIRQLLCKLFHFSTCIIGYQGKRKIHLSFSDF